MKIIISSTHATFYQPLRLSVWSPGHVLARECQPVPLAVLRLDVVDHGGDVGRGGGDDDLVEVEHGDVVEQVAVSLGNFKTVV